MNLADFIETTLTLVHPSPTNPRKSFPAEEMAEMIDSVKRHGILQPILVRPWPATYSAGENNFPAYELVAGERRYRAAKAAGLDSIPVMIRNLDDNEVLEIQIIENLQRKGLHELEEAEGYELMIRDHGYNADQLAEKIGKSRAYIYGRMKLLALCTGARLAFRDKKLTASTALLIARIPSEKMQMEAIDKITGTWEGIMSFRRAAEIIQRDFCFYLEKAPFPQENLMLVTTAGACSTCPKRSGTSPELHPETTRTDVCTDPGCYRAKSQAWISYQAGEAKKDGKKVITGKEAEKIDIEYSSGGYEKLDSTNYHVKLPGKDYVTNREILEFLGDKAPESVLIENQRKGALVEAVSNDQLKKALSAAGIKQNTGCEKSPEQKKNEAKAKEETEFRRRLFEQLRIATRADMLEAGANFEIEESLLIARQFWACLYFDNQKSVARYWIEDPAIKDRDLIDAMTEKLNELGQHDLHIFLLDCSLIGQVPVYPHNLENDAPGLFERAKAHAIDLEAARKGDDGKKAPAPTAKITPPPTEAPLGAALTGAEIKQMFLVGDRVLINADAKGPSGHLRKCCGKEGDIEAIRGDVYAVRFAPGKSGVVADLKRDEFTLVPQPISFSPSKAARAAVEYAHPENSDLCWSGRGKKPKWVEAWLSQESGRTLDQLRVQGEGQKQSSAAGAANAKQSMAEVVTRCTKTLELPLA